jgi:phosphoglycerate kinase
MIDYLQEIKNRNLFVSNQLNEIDGKRIFLRIDTNSAIVNGNLDLDSYKLFAHAQTLKEYVDAGALPIIITHQGRKGDDEFIPDLEPIARKMEEISEVKVNYIDEIMSEKVGLAINNLKLGEALLIKNIRDHPHETDLESIEDMVSSPLTQFFKNQVDVFINDGLSVCHRCQLSVVALTKIIPFYFGLLLESELQRIQELRNDLKNGKDVTFFIGGKKFEKLNYLEKILEYPGVRFLTGGLIGQYIAYADGLEFNEKNKKFMKSSEIENARRLLDKFRNKIFYPLDFTMEDGNSVARGRLRSSNGFIMDIGPETLNYYAKNVNGRSVFAGVMGVFEKGFDNTLRLLRMAAAPDTVNLGGHSSAALFQDHGIYNYFTQRGGKVITAGGAALALLAGEKMPGLDTCFCKDKK